MPVLNPAGIPARPEDRALEAIGPLDRLTIDLYNSLPDEIREKLGSEHDVVARLTLNERGNPSLTFQPVAKIGASAIDRFVFEFYNVLTDTLKAVVSAGITVSAQLTQSPDGTLSVVIESTRPVRAIDTKNKVVYLEPDAQEEQKQAPSPVPDVQGQPADGQAAGQAEA